MSLPFAIPAAILDTVVAHLLPLFMIGAHGDADIARQAALRMLVRYNPRSEPELCLAAQIISFELHALEAMARADDPELPLTHALRLRSGAISMNREAQRCREQLRQMQAADPAPAPELAAPEAAEPTPAQARAEAAIAAVEEARQVPVRTGKPGKQGRYGGLTYSQALSKRMMANRINENQKRRAAEHAARLAASGTDQPAAAL